MVLLIYLTGGVLCGILSSWVGAGGGAIIIPLILLVCKYQGIPGAIAIHLAVATSLGFIMVNAFYVAYKHHKHGHLIIDILKKAMPALLIGAIVGTFIGKMMSENGIEFLFAAVLLVSLIKTFWVSKQAGTGAQSILPSATSCASFGALTGVLSSIVGIGGSSIVNPYMKHYNFPMKNCAAMSAATAVPVGLFATITMLVSSYHVAGLPAYSLGYLYLPAFFGLLLGSVIGTPIGVKIVKICPEGISLWVFRLLLLYVICDMLIS
ncbi:sulfite exporter TauE/SafE family protein [Dongshaea marina]|uniref:sulfite exporter TauE/SafE family protein n=1 Tax=Dongshaea marina TaxID=2047966 RepID=UPI000D3EC56C|nr:sulfite exporter TauE/SafE family protein [Dongshaea marina]